MKRFLMAGLLMTFSAAVYAANVRVQQRGAEDGPHQDSSGGSASAPVAVDVSNRPVSQPSQAAAPGVGRTRVVPQTTSHHSGWGRNGGHNGNRVRTPAYSNSAARVHVTPSAGHAWRSGYSRPYRYTRYRGHDWYGYSVGPRHYWSRWYSNRWWWYDVQMTRWAFWSAGYWWYGAPNGVMYVYVNDSYVPYQSGVVAVAPPAAVPPPTDADAPPVTTETSAAPASNDQSFNSPDSQRMVQIVGPNSEAFLYDVSSGKPVFMQYLVKDATRVRFAGGKDGKPLQILVDFKSGEFAIYDADGRVQSGSAPRLAADVSAPVQPPLPAPLPE